MTSVMPDMTYLDLQAYLGTTKHMGGQSTTEELISLCHIGAGTTVLDVGCGVGATACHLVKAAGCRVMGVDLRPAMIAHANERARHEGIADRVACNVADAQHLPFEDAAFDAVLCESVATFVEDKARLVAEMMRVIRPGGYVGLNEEVWIDTPPPDDIAAYVRHTWEIDWDIPTAEGWTALLEGAGLQDVRVRTCRFDPRREASQLRRYRAGDMLRMGYRTLALYAKSPAFRAYMAQRKTPPRHLFAYLGYATAVGRSG
jgi:SAM-dependent methyltransferase